MSIMRCDKHDNFYDSDFEEDCPECENQEDGFEDCEWCDGTGVVTVDEFDKDSGQYTHGTGVKKCTCQLE